jgi:hypothetical protein
MSNAQTNLAVTNSSSQASRLSTSCPSLNDPADAILLLEQTSFSSSKVTNISSNDYSNNHDNRNQNVNNQQQRPSTSRRKNNNEKIGASSSSHRKTRQGRHRSVNSVSSGDSDDEGMDCVDASASAKIRQRSASTAPKESNATPPTFKESRFFHTNR